jgi:hypothetical protein
MGRPPKNGTFTTRSARTGPNTTILSLPPRRWRTTTVCAVVSLPLAESGLCPLVVELRSTAPTFFVEPVHSCGLARAPPLA